jgi:hypothetical protein
VDACRTGNLTNTNLQRYRCTNMLGLKRVQINSKQHLVIKTTSFTPPSVIKLYLLSVYAFTCFGFLVNHLQKVHQLCKGNYHYVIHSYIKLVPTDFYVQVKMCSFLYNVDWPSEDRLLRTETCKGVCKQ